jgi:CPA1 family monovalent cation:H+ antiporter
MKVDMGIWQRVSEASAACGLQEGITAGQPSGEDGERAELEDFVTLHALTRRARRLQPLSWALLSHRLMRSPRWPLQKGCACLAVFILIGFQLPEVLRTLSDQSFLRLAWYAALISLAVIVVRIIWVFPASYLPRFLSKKIRAKDPYPPWQHIAIVGWSGMRGVGSLAAALAIPLTVQNGASFPGRDLILFLTYAVIFATLVLQGLSLPAIIRWLGVEDDRIIEREEREARLRTNQAALDLLNKLLEGKSGNGEALQRLREEYGGPYPPIGSRRS